MGIPAAEDTDDILGAPSVNVETSHEASQKEEKNNVDTEHAPSKNDDKNPKPKTLFDRFFADAPTKERGDNRNFATRLTDSITGKLTLSDKYSININELLQEALDEIYNNEKEGKEQPIVSRPLFDISNGALQHGINTAFADPEFGKKNEEFINEFRHNTAVFAAFKNHQQTREIVALLHDENGNLRSFSKFKKLALQVSKDYNVNWLQTEYNTAVRSARMAVNYHKWLETEHLYPNLEYMESVASHKRDSHLDYVGTVLPIRHQWWNTHMPPSDWNCACSVRPTDKDATPGDEFVSPVFQNNPGKTAEFVNLKEHPYVKGVCPYFDTCQRRTAAADLQCVPKLADNNANPHIIPQCAICELAKAYFKNVERKQKEIRKWYKNNLREVKVGKFTAKRFEIEHLDITQKIIINKNFYNEVSGKYTNDAKYFERMELLKIAHELIKESRYIGNELPKHYDDAALFLLFKYEKNGLKLIFKCKQNTDGLFLHYMQHE